MRSFFVTLDQEGNSVAVIMKHMAGNMFSRWTDFLTSDGEKPNRNRDMEFVIEPTSGKEDVVAYWEKGWQIIFLAKHFRSTEWRSLTIPRNRSGEFNAYLAEKPGVADKEKQLDTVADFLNSAERQGER